MAERPPGVSTYYPRYGTVRSLLLFGLLYLVVGHVTGAFVDTLASVAPSVDPGPARLGMAVILWVAFAGVVIGELHRQARGNPEQFVAREVLVEFADHHRPTSREHAGWLLMSLVGATSAFLARERFFGALDDALLVGERLAVRDSLGSFSPVTLAWSVAFLLGFGLLAYATDRVVIGTTREALYRYHRRRGE